MHIAINCRSFLSRSYTGIGRYAYNLINSLTKIDAKNQYSLYVQRGFWHTNRRVPRFNAKNFKVKIDFFKKGIDRTIGDFDLYHSPSMDLINIKKAKVVVTVHDLVYKAYPEGHTQETIRLTEEHFQSFIPRATKIICCSKNTVNDLKKYFNVEDRRIRLVYQGVDKDVFYPLSAQARQAVKAKFIQRGVSEPYILFVGTIEPRKNLMNLMEAFRLLKESKKFSGKLVVVGMLGWKSEGLVERIQKMNLVQDVIFLGFVSNDELRELYNLAEIFAFPSCYEGFGYPILEAFSCGAAVVTSNTASCPEIAQDAAVLVNPHDPQSIAQALTKVIQDPVFKSSLQQKGLARCQDFSYEKTASETLQVYEEALNS
jgi:glycosyltransferase involved in cell wall biosynthesis